MFILKLIPSCFRSILKNKSQGCSQQYSEDSFAESYQNTYENSFEESSDKRQDVSVYYNAESEYIGMSAGNACIALEEIT